MILIKNAIIIAGPAAKDSAQDLLVKENKIFKIGDCGSFDKEKELKVIDAKGQWLLPGLIDIHVHLREPGLEWKETIATGSEAAIAGGYTTICPMPNTKPTNDSVDTTQFMIEQGRVNNGARIKPIGAVSIGLKGEKLSPLTKLYNAGCVAFSDDGEPVFNSGMMRRALEWCKLHDAVICCHEEDKCLSCGGAMNESPLSYELGIKPFSEISEDVMVARDIELARFTGGHVHICHISTTRSVELVRRAKADGIKVSCEVTPHHLVLTEQAVKTYDANYKMSPPLRTEETRQALIAGLVDGTIDCVASDHAPHEPDTKNTSFEAASFGILGLQTSLPLLLEFQREGVISKERLVDVLSKNPAEIIRQDTGVIEAGKLADLILVDPNEEWIYDIESNLSKSINSPFLGKTMQGKVKTVIVDGNIKMESN